jgi:TetR/AcrR family transcriptional repressor of mexJK operon
MQAWQMLSLRPALAFHHPHPASSMSALPHLRRVGRPKSDDVLSIREDIISAARQLFLEHGIAGTGMEAIAKAAGVTKQTLYARFPNKSELCQAVMEEVMRQWREHQGPLLGDFTTLEEALYQHSIRTLQTATREGSALLAQFLSNEGRFQPELARDILGSIRAKGIQDIETILHAFAVSKADTASTRQAAEFYFMALVGKINDMNALPGEADMHDVVSWAKTAASLFSSGYLGRS